MTERKQALSELEVNFEEEHIFIHRFVFKVGVLYESL